MAWRIVPILAFLLAGCAGVNVTVNSLDFPPTALGWEQADFTTARFVTTAEVALRDGQEEEEAHVVAMLPEGTPLVPSGARGGECTCWRVHTPAGTGWLYTRYIALRLPPE
jgi:hypothetical protein